jgi:hypothetical protein
MGVYDLPTAQQKVTDYTTQRYGRGPQNQQEWGAVAQGINYGDGVDDNELTQAYGNADTYASSLGAQPNPQAPAANPGASNQQPAAGNVSPATSSQMPPMAAAYGQQQAAPQSPIQQAFQGSLLNMLNRSQQTPSLSDPNLAPQVDVFRAAQQRSAERQRASAAERMSQQGTLDSGAFDTQVGQIDAKRGLNEANFESGLLGGEMNARRDELSRALGLAGAAGDTQSAQALQRELATLDVALREKGLGLQDKFGTADLGLRQNALTQQGQLGRGDLALRLMLGLQGNQQFYDQLGLGAGQWLADFNQNNFMNYMGGF